MNSIGEVIQEKCMAFDDRVIKLNDYLLAHAVTAHEECKKLKLQKKGKNILHLTSVGRMVYFNKKIIFPEFL